MYFSKKIIAMLSLLLLLGLSACADKGQEEDTAPNLDQPIEIEFSELDRSQLSEDKIVAVYEQGEITGSQFADYLAFRGFMNPDLDVNNQEVRESLIKDYIFEHIFKEKGELTAEIEEQAEGIWMQIEMIYSEDTRQEGFEKLGTSEEDVKENLLTYLTANVAAHEHFQAQITDEEIHTRYQDPEVQEQITIADVRHILIKTHDFTEQGSLEEVRSVEEAKQIVDDLYAQLQEGADFAQLASEYSEDEGSKANGGLYTDAAVVQWVPEFKQAALEQEINELGQPVQTMYGFHLIRVEKRSVKPLSEVRQGILNELTSQKLISYYEETLPTLIKEINM